MIDRSSLVDHDDGASWWQRLRRSPLRDVARGRLSGRLGWKQRVLTSNLPPELRKIVLEVTRRARLTRLERCDIADELIAHFLDGLDRSVDIAELADAFGEPRHAARLIARARKRNRPVVVRAAVRSLQATGLALCLLVLLYGISAAQFFLEHPSPTVDYRVQINAAALALPEADRAWPHYRQALLALPDAPDHAGLSNRPPRPGEAGWEHLESFLTANRAELDRVRQAGTMPGLGFVTGYAIDEADQELWPDLEFSEENLDKGGLFSILLPHLSELRTLTKLLGHDAQRAAEQGDGATVVDNLEAMLGISCQLREAPFLIGDLVALATFGQAMETAGDVIAHHPELLTELQLQSLAHLIAAFDDEALRVRLEIERIAFDDLVQRMYSDDGKGDGRLTAEGSRFLAGMVSYTAGGEPLEQELLTVKIAGPALRHLMLSRREALDTYDELMNLAIAESHVPLWERPASEANSRINTLHSTFIDQLRYFPVVMLMPALSAASIQGDIAIMRRDALLGGIAVVIHRRRHDAWPASLAELTPQLLPAPPVDHFDGAPLRYGLIDGMPRLYSVGVDRDDDGGRNHPEAFRWRPIEAVNMPVRDRSIADGDWQLWPPVVDPLEVFVTDEAPPD